MQKGVQIAAKKRKERHQVAVGECQLCNPGVKVHNFSKRNMSNEKKLLRLTLKLALAFIFTYGHTHTHNRIFTCIQHSKLINTITFILSLGYTIKQILTSVIILTHFNTCTLSQAYIQAHTHIQTYRQSYSYSQSYIIVVMKKPPMCQFIHFSLYRMNGSIKGKHID